jgi:hypothetical protein
MKLATEFKSRVSATASPQLRKIIEGMRDTALGVVGLNGNKWETIAIEWHENRAKAIISNLGRGSLGLTLNSETYSSNGVHSRFTFEVSVGDYALNQAHETWSADWTHPAPGSSFGRREGDDVITQLDAEVSRFIDPITTDNVSVSVN